MGKGQEQLILILDFLPKEVESSSLESLNKKTTREGNQTEQKCKKKIIWVIN